VRFTSLSQGHTSAQIVSTMHLKMNFPLAREKVVAMKVNHKVARKFYENNQKARRITYCIAAVTNSNISELDP